MDHRSRDQEQFTRSRFCPLASVIVIGLGFGVLWISTRKPTIVPAILDLHGNAIPRPNHPVIKYAVIALALAIVSAGSFLEGWRLTHQPSAQLSTGEMKVVPNVPPSPNTPAPGSSNAKSVRDSKPNPPWKWEQVPDKPITETNGPKEGKNPGVTALITAKSLIANPAFELTCTVPCVYYNAMAIGSATWPDQLPSQRPNIVRVRFRIPAELKSGDQLTIAIRSMDQNLVTLSKVIRIAP
jgi:hypothetical protein